MSDKTKGFGNKENEDKREIFRRSERKFHPFSENKAYFSKASQPLDLIKNRAKREEEKVKKEIERDLPKKERIKGEIGEVFEVDALKNDVKKARLMEHSFIEISNKYTNFQNRLVRINKKIQEQYMNSIEKELERNSKIAEIDEVIATKEGGITTLETLDTKDAGRERRRLRREQFRKEFSKRMLTDKNSRSEKWRLILEGRINWRNKQIQALEHLVSEIDQGHLMDASHTKKYWPSGMTDYTDYMREMVPMVDQCYKETLEVDNVDDFKQQSQIIKAGLKLRTLSLANYTEQRELGARIQQLQQNIDDRQEIVDKLYDDKYHKQLGEEWEKQKNKLNSELIDKGIEMEKFKESYQKFKVLFGKIGKENELLLAQPSNVQFYDNTGGMSRGAGSIRNRRDLSDIQWWSPDGELKRRKEKERALDAENDSNDRHGKYRFKMLKFETKSSRLRKEIEALRAENTELKGKAYQQEMIETQSPNPGDQNWGFTDLRPTGNDTGSKGSPPLPPVHLGNPQKTTVRDETEEIEEQV